MAAAAKQKSAKFRASVKEIPKYDMYLFNGDISFDMAEETEKIIKDTGFIIDSDDATKATIMTAIKEDDTLCRLLINTEFISESITENLLFVITEKDDPSLINAIATVKPFDDKQPFIEIELLCSSSESSFKNIAAELMYFMALMFEQFDITHFRLRAIPEAVDYYTKLGFEAYINTINKRYDGLYPLMISVADILYGKSNNSGYSYGTPNWEAVRNANLSATRERRLDAAKYSLQKAKDTVARLEKVVEALEKAKAEGKAARSVAAAAGVPTAAAAALPVVAAATSAAAAAGAKTPADAAAAAIEAIRQSVLKHVASKAVVAPRKGAAVALAAPASTRSRRHRHRHGSRQGAGAGAGAGAGSTRKRR
jgi:hypothetical protein